MGKLFIAILISFTTASALGASKSKSAEIEKCIAKVVGGKQTVFSKQQLKTIIEGDLGEGTLPTTLKREYIRDGQTIVTLSLYVKRSANYTSRRLAMNISGIEKERRSEFVSILLGDLESLERDSQVSAYTPDPDNAIRGRFETADYLVASSYRHPLTAEEAAKFFALVDLILDNRLRGIEELKDSVTTPALEKPDVQF